MNKKWQTNSWLYYGAVVVYALVVMSLMILVTDFDEDLSPHLAKELAFPEPSFDEENVFFDFIGLSQVEPDDDFWLAGWDTVEEDYQRYQDAERAVYDSLITDSSSSFKLTCNPTGKSCFIGLVIQSEEAAIWLEENKPLVSAVDAIVLGAKFQEQIVLSDHYNASWFKLNAVRQAKWAVATELWRTRQYVQAVETVKPYMNFCRRLLKSSVTLWSRSLAITCTVNDMRFIAAWYAFNSTQSDFLTVQLEDWLKPITLDEIKMRESLLHEVRMLSRGGDVFMNGVREELNIEGDIYDLEKIESKRILAMLFDFLVKPNDIARDCYERFEGMLTLADTGFAIAEVPWTKQAPKPLLRRITRNYFGREAVSTIKLKPYEHYLHNAHSPLMHQTLLRAVIHCTKKMDAVAVENCFRSDLSSYVGVFYTDSVIWDSEHNFLWLPAPKALTDKRGYIKIYVDMNLLTKR
jgi:hypothetical protein